MYFKEYLKRFDNKKIELYVDMDGVVADYDVGSATNFDKKRPLYTSINKLKEISEMDNVTIHILSVTRYNTGYEEKNYWLDKYMNFIDKDNRAILSREDNNMLSFSELKNNYLNSLKRINDGIYILIDDDPRVLDKIKEYNNDIYLFKDTCLID